MSHKLSQICNDPKKISTKYLYPLKIFIFLTPPPPPKKKKIKKKINKINKKKNIEIQNFEQKKNSPKLRICENIRVPALPPPQGGGGGGYSNFFLIRRLGPSTYRSPPKKYQEFQAPQKIFEILATPKNIAIL